MIHLKGGHIVDPVTGRDGVGDLWIDGDRIADPPASAAGHATIDATGHVVMAGGIDIHSHIAGGNVSTARLLLPEFHHAHLSRPLETPLGKVGWTAEETGRLYAEMGFTTVVEPAVVPSNALHAHLELADIPIIDKAGLCVLGNDDFLLALLREGESRAAVADYVAYMLETTRTLGIKTINAGAAAAFKANARTFDLDDVVPDYGVTSRAIVEALQQAVADLGVPHPLHVHCNNLGAPLEGASAIATMGLAGDLPLHLAHLQFYGYGAAGKRRFSSVAAQLAEEVNRRPNVTIDVGQVMFGQTVTVSCDVMRQFAARNDARPRKWVIWDGDSSGGGIVPYPYRASSFFNAVQWAVGLELFLLIDDPWRVFFTTDHPNGAPFTAYPHLFALLMERQVREAFIAKLPKSAMAATTLASISREYTLSEIAVMTRAAPARLLGLEDRGNLRPGSRADVAVYQDNSDRSAMFGSAARVFKDGMLVVENGNVVATPRGKALTLAAKAPAEMRRRMAAFHEQSYGAPSSLFTVPGHLLGPAEPFAAVPCRSS